MNCVNIRVTRSDWRFCKRPESMLVQAIMNRLENFDEEEQEEMVTWTLYGQGLLQKDPYWFHNRFPHHPPEEEDMYHFQEWYRQRLLWIRYGRYFTGQMKFGR